MTLRDSARRLVDSPATQRTITAVILINAAVLGMETSTWMTDRVGDLLVWTDRMALSIFVLELLVKIYAYRRRFFLDPWNIFDLLVISISLVPVTESLSILRALRVLRLLRLVSLVPSMRRVVATLLNAIPGMASIIGLLVLMLYVAAVMGTQLFGAQSPDHFGDLGTSLWTLFVAATGEGWPDVAEDVMAAQTWAWVFFLVYVLVSTFVIINLFIAVLVSAAEQVSDEDGPAPDRTGHPAGPTEPAVAVDPATESDRAHQDLVLAELAEVRAELRELRAALTTEEPRDRRVNDHATRTS